MSFFDRKVVRHANSVVQAAIDDLLSTDARGAVVGIAPAGAGKSYALGTAVAAARAKGRRIAVAAPTNEQAFALVKGLAYRLPRQRITYVPRSDLDVPSDVLLPNVERRKAGDANTGSLLVGTLNKLGDACARGDLQPVDILLIDEAYQASSVHYYLVGQLAPRHLLMGDSGQLAPFTTAPEGDRWRGLSEDPLLTAIEVLQRNHPTTKQHRLPVTRRLDPRAIPVVRSFYPGHSFGAAVLPGVRHLKLNGASAKRSYRVEDAVLGMAARNGWAHLELPGSAVISADPATIKSIVSLLQRLFERNPTVRCERQTKLHQLQPRDVAVVVSHNDQKALARIALDQQGFGDVEVNTANKLQGLTFEFVIAWHPLAGLVDVDDFHLDPGRLCVMLTRHRQACIVVGRAADRELVRGIPPATPSYVGWNPNPVLDGWYVHEAVFAALEPFHVAP